MPPQPQERQPDQIPERHRDERREQQRGPHRPLCLHREDTDRVCTDGEEPALTERHLPRKPHQQRQARAHDGVQPHKGEDVHLVGRQKRGRHRRPHDCEQHQHRHDHTTHVHDAPQSKAKRKGRKDTKSAKKYRRIVKGNCFLSYFLRALCVFAPFALRLAPPLPPREEAVRAGDENGDHHDEGDHELIRGVEVACHHRLCDAQKEATDYRTCRVDEAPDDGPREPVHCDIDPRVARQGASGVPIAPANAPKAADTANANRAIWRGSIPTSEAARALRAHAVTALPM